MKYLLGEGVVEVAGQEIVEYPHGDIGHSVLKLVVLELRPDVGTYFGTRHAEVGLAHL